MGLEGVQCWACAGAHSSKGNKTPKVLSALGLFRSITEFCMEMSPSLEMMEWDTVFLKAAYTKLRVVRLGRNQL